MSELRHNKDGSTTIGPVDPHLRLVEALADYAAMGAASKEDMRKLAWFLGDRGCKEAAIAIMEHAKVVEYGYFYGFRVPVQ
jgi:hypothetical protein